MYRTKSYQIDTPEALWREFTAIHDDRDRINSRLVELVAQDVREEVDGGLDPQVRGEINRILEGDLDGA
ncbi:MULTISPECIES: hypothetical protein [Halolamina]|uniref:Uncharacterized protein n=1 Tax=Halolamina pelagica TaxID=699431 RepID=A0A1I5VR90_9EURY|nr:MULTISPECIES: hypothetical protein [Halolamina]NHX37816.1 hypothetical protein [Halolamina sp. R1-12]SFQ09933.1 hypothetical protein SAMN05216277_11937 [Halolamina pelagica]